MIIEILPTVGPSGKGYEVVRKEASGDGSDALLFHARDFDAALEFLHEAPTFCFWHLLGQLIDESRALFEFVLREPTAHARAAWLAEKSPQFFAKCGSRAEPHPERK